MEHLLQGLPERQVMFVEQRAEPEQEFPALVHRQAVEQKLPQEF